MPGRPVPSQDDTDALKTLFYLLLRMSVAFTRVSLSSGHGEFGKVKLKVDTCELCSASDGPAVRGCGLQPT